MKKYKAGITLFIFLIFLFVIFGILVTVTSSAGNVSKGTDELVKLDFSGVYYSDNEKRISINSISDFEYDGSDRVTFIGKFSEEIPEDKYLIIAVSNLWLKVEADSKVVGDNHLNKGGKTNTPGISYIYISGKDIPKDAEIRLSFENPYILLSNADPIRDCFEFVGYGEKSTPYAELLGKHSLSIAVSLAICFLGMFAFFLAGLLLKDILFRNICLAFLALVGGMYVLMDNIHIYLPLWINDPVKCMILSEFAAYLLPVAAFLYLRLFVEDRRTSIFLNIVTSVSILVSGIAFFLQIFGVMDILMSKYYFFIFVALGVVVSIGILIFEGFILKSKSILKLFVTIVPLIAASTFDSLNVWLAFAPGKTTMRLGLLFTIAFQIYFLITETIRHNKEIAKYQQMQHDMLKMRVSIMATQIQPHFLYNSLTSIAMLCEKDPSKAKKATIDFADYMRRNMNSLKDENPVPFESELKHLRTYVSLEKMRFGEELEVIFDIETTDFTIPSLTVQPLVENAIKHGVGMREDGGTVVIRTSETAEFYEICVQDDGVGFDVNKSFDDGRTHVGMENVKNRLATMCNAVVEITSEVGTGTTAKIIIPKEKKK